MQNMSCIAHHQRQRLHLHPSLHICHDSAICQRLARCSMPLHARLDLRILIGLQAHTGHASKAFRSRVIEVQIHHIWRGCPCWACTKDAPG